MGSNDRSAQLEVLNSPVSWMRQLSSIWNELFGHGPLAATNAVEITPDACERAVVYNGNHVRIELEAPRFAHTEALHLPTRDALLHKQAIELNLKLLSPISPDHLTTSAILTDQEPKGQTRYLLAMARTELLNQLTSTCMQNGARSVSFVVKSGNASIPVRSAPQRQHLFKRRIVNSLLCLAALILPIAAIFLADQSLEHRLQLAKSLEATLRKDVIQQIDAEKSLQNARQTLQAEPDLRRTGRILEAIDKLNTATPDTAWWQAFSWSIDEMKIALRTNADLPSELQAMNDALPGFDSTLNGDVSSSRELQSAEIAITAWQSSDIDSGPER